MYIEINLLPRDLRPKKRLIAIDHRFLMILLIVIAAGGLAGYYFHISDNLQKQEAELSNWKKQVAMLQEAVDLQNEVITLREDVAKRINIIKELTGDSNLRFAMFQHINNIIPENLWLLAIRETIEGNIISFSIEGMSYSKQNITQFFSDLQKYEKFTSVSLESIQPAPLEIRDAYQYAVRVELESSKPVVEETEIPSRDSRRGRR